MSELHYTYTFNLQDVCIRINEALSAVSPGWLFDSHVVSLKRDQTRATEWVQVRMQMRN